MKQVSLWLLACVCVVIMCACLVPCANGLSAEEKRRLAEEALREAAALEAELDGDDADELPTPETLPSTTSPEPPASASVPSSEEPKPMMEDTPRSEPVGQQASNRGAETAADGSPPAAAESWEVRRLAELEKNLASYEATLAGLLEDQVLLGRQVADWTRRRDELVSVVQHLRRRQQTPGAAAAGSEEAPGTPASSSPATGTAAPPAAEPLPETAQPQQEKAQEKAADDTAERVVVMDVDGDQADRQTSFTPEHDLLNNARRVALKRRKERQAKKEQAQQQAPTAAAAGQPQPQQQRAPPPKPTPAAPTEAPQATTKKAAEPTSKAARVEAKMAREAERAQLLGERIDHMKRRKEKNAASDAAPVPKKSSNRRRYDPDTDYVSELLNADGQRGAGRQDTPQPPDTAAEQKQKEMANPDPFSKRASGDAPPPAAESATDPTASADVFAAAAKKAPGSATNPPQASFQQVADPPSFAATIAAKAMQAEKAPREAPTNSDAGAADATAVNLDLGYDDPRLARAMKRLAGEEKERFHKRLHEQRTRPGAVIEDLDVKTVAPEEPPLDAAKLKRFVEFDKSMEKKVNLFKKMGGPAAAGAAPPAAPPPAPGTTKKP